jgi:hypothetical protein
MSCELAAVRRDGPIYRLGRRPDAWEWPDWAYAGHDGTFGNRFDDPHGEYRVLYATSQRLGAFVETLARFRPDLAVVAALEEIDGEDDGTRRAGRVPVSWVDARAVGEAATSVAFADIADVRSLAHLRERMAARALHHGFDDIDAAVIRARAPRAFSQELSRLVYECAEPDGRRSFGGIRYPSRLGDQFENWAIFEPADPDEAAIEGAMSAQIQADDGDLAAAIALLGLELT